MKLFLSARSLEVHLFVHFFYASQELFIMFRDNKKLKKNALFLDFFIEWRSVEMLLLSEISKALCFRNKLDPRIDFRSEDLFLDCFGLSISCHPLSLPFVKDRRLPEPFPEIYR